MIGFAKCLADTCNWKLTENCKSDRSMKKVPFFTVTIPLNNFSCNSLSNYYKRPYFYCELSGETVYFESKIARFDWIPHPRSYLNTLFSNSYISNCLHYRSIRDLYKINFLDQDFSKILNDVQILKLRSSIKNWYLRFY